MKKKIKLLILLILVILIISLIRFIIKKEHDINYETSKYKIHETYKYKNKIHTYTLKIKNKDNTYSFVLNNNIHKKKQIVTEIKTYRKDNITCIIPIYKTKKIENNLYCTKDNIQVSNYYLKDNDNYKKILKQVKKYNISSLNSSDTKKEYKKLTIFNKNISNDEVYTIWDYKGIYILKNNSYSYQKILNEDLYDNIMSTIVDKYYVLFENTSVNGIEKVYYYDLEKEKLKEFNLNEVISKDSYINGTYKSYIYLTDRKEKKQYKLNIKTKKIEQVNNGDVNYLYYKNDNFQKMNKTEFFKEDMLFKKYKENKKYEDSKYYYYYENNKFYRQIKKENKVLLFELKEVDEWMVVGDNIILISDGIVYNYSDNTGLRMILESNELKYNYKNIYNYWKKD